MAGLSRYSVVEDEISVERVLKNKLGITDQKTLSDVEAILLDDAYTHFFNLLTKKDLVPDLSLLFHIHKFFLEPLYSWAGKLRTVDLSKDGVLFASVKYLDKALLNVEELIKKNIPIKTDLKRIVANKLAVIHCELNAVHPFREGNGRTIRLFLDLLTVRAGYFPIDWSKKSQTAYIHACTDGMKQEYRSMEKVIYAGLVKQK